MAEAAPFLPRVKGKTTSVSPDVSSLMSQMDDQTYYVPDYQRDSSQWDAAKKSLFIDSLINNMTIPPLIVYPETDPKSGVERNQIVDGQQRLSTIRDFLKGVFALESETEVEYADNVGAIIQGKRFDELPESMRKQISRYTLNIIVLPKDLDLGLRLEIFRRINEAGTPLSSHDLRLAIFGRSDRVYFIRLAGVFDQSREGASRMIKAGKENFGIDYPWEKPDAWKTWWLDKAQSAGQVPSQMFMYYVMARDIGNVDKLIASDRLQEKLGIKYDRTTISVLDLYAAQLQLEALAGDAPKMLADLDTLKKWFTDFELWFNQIKEAKVATISPNSATKIALFIAAAAQVWGTPDRVTDRQWEAIEVLLTNGPGGIKTKLGFDYPITKGKWPGQKTQIDKTVEVCREIAKK
jgi:hypothetical protein